MVSSGEAVLFWVLAPLMVAAALGLVFAKKAIHATMSVVFVMLCLAVLYVAQEAPFLGIVQVVVYTGAVMMLFLFVIMLVGVDAQASFVETLKGQRVIGGLLVLGLAVVMGSFIARVSFEQVDGYPVLAEVDIDNPALLARALMTNFVFPMEVVGILLITAAIAALTLTHKRRLTPKVTQADLARERVAAGARLTPLAAPGVYATRNAMDVPALDPEGNPIEESISRVLKIRQQMQDAPIDEQIAQLTTPVVEEDPWEEE